MRVSRRVWLALVLWLGLGTIALAEVQLERGSLHEGWGGGIEVSLTLTGPAPWRARVLAEPPRLVLDFRDTAIAQVPFAPRKRVTAVEAGNLRPGWSRMVLTLGGPYTITTAEMRVRDKATVEVMLEPATEEAFRAAAPSARTRGVDPAHGHAAARHRRRRPASGDAGSRSWRHRSRPAAA